MAERQTRRSWETTAAVSHRSLSWTIIGTSVRFRASRFPMITHHPCPRGAIRGAIEAGASGVRVPAGPELPEAPAPLLLPDRRPAGRVGVQAGLPRGAR